MEGILQSKKLISQLEKGIPMRRLQAERAYLEELTAIGEEEKRAEALLAALQNEG